MVFNLGHVIGADGKGIQSITKTGTSGLVDTYTITYTDGTTQTYTVTNGEDGTGGADIVTAWEQTLSDEKIPSEKLTKNTLDLKLEGNKVTSWSGTVSDNNIPSEKLVKDSLDGKVTGTKVTSWSGTLADTHIPSEKLVKISLDGKQATLESGTNIKTVNGNSLLGSGDITVGADAGSFGDLRDLIDEASSGDVLVLDKDYKNTGSESEIEIDKPLTIIGNGHILDADGKSRIFTIPNTGNGCKINGLIFTNGKTSSVNGGGAIYCQSSTITNCSFNNNSAKVGGAITCLSSNNIISDCSFNNNSVTSKGGAIYCPSSTIISDCEFNENTATNGGNVYNSGTDPLTIYNCHVITGLYNTVNYDDLNSKDLVTSWSSTTTDTNIPSEKLVKDSIDGLTIPTKISDLTNDSDFIETSTTNGLIRNDGTIDTNAYIDTDDIANNLTTTTAGKVLDARQGKALADLIGDAITYINQ